MNTQTVKVKKLDPEARLPKKGSEGAACFDVWALPDTEPAVVWDKHDDRVQNAFDNNIGYSVYTTYMYSTGLSLEIPEGYEVVVRPRSSICKTQAHIANSPGTIDSDYRGELKILFRAPSWYGLPYQPGERIAQIKLQKVIPTEFELVEELVCTERGDGGFGSTGTV